MGFGKGVLGMNGHRKGEGWNTCIWKTIPIVMPSLYFLFFSLGKKGTSSVHLCTERREYLRCTLRM